MKVRAIVGLLLVGATLAIAGTGVRHYYGQRWEYKIVQTGTMSVVNTKYNESIVTPLGADGWEAVGSVGESSNGTYLLFKRPLP